jgi:hypothetical protein
LCRGDSASIYTFELTDKHKVHSYKTTWDSYLGSLKQNKSGESVTGMRVYHPSYYLHKGDLTL